MSQPQSKTVGRCSLCGGRVSMPDHWMSIVPPGPTCDACGAVAKASGPTIPMERPDDSVRRSRKREGGMIEVEAGPPQICGECGCEGLHFCSGKPKPPGAPRGYALVRRRSRWTSHAPPAE